MGKVYREYRISMAEMLSGISAQFLLDSQVEFLLAVLPKGAKHIATQKTDRLDIALSYILVFDHPLFENGTTMQVLTVKRSYENPLKPGQHREFETVTGIRYIGPDGNPYFESENASV